MLQIRLNKGSASEGGGGGSGVKLSPVETVTVACPDHLVLADLPVAKVIGAATATSLVKSVGRRSRRHLGERVHICVRCDFPIAIYGRLSPCEHAFCLDCARSDSICYLCDERIQKIQTVKMMEGIFVCAAPHCLKSFMKRSEFESHIQNSHPNLLQSNAAKDGQEPEVQSGRQSASLESTMRASMMRPINPSGSSSQLHDHEDKGWRQQPREHMPPKQTSQPKPPQYFGQGQNYPLEPQGDGPPGFEKPALHNHFSQQQEAGQHTIQPESFPDYPHNPMQPPGFAMPLNSNPAHVPQYGFPPFPSDGTQQVYGAQYEIPRQDSVPDTGSEHGSLGYPSGQAGGFTGSYSQHYNAGAGHVNSDYGHNSGLFTPPPHMTNRGMDQGGSSMDPREGKGILAPQPLLHPPPPSAQVPPHQAHMRRGTYFSTDGRQHENRDSFGSAQD